jgi:hypothetical protein
VATRSRARTHAGQVSTVERLAYGVLSDAEYGGGLARGQVLVLAAGHATSWENAEDPPYGAVWQIIGERASSRPDIC